MRYLYMLGLGFTALATACVATPADPEAGGDEGSDLQNTAVVNAAVSVDAGAVLRTIPRDIFGTNIAAWAPLVDSGEAAFEQALQIAGTTQIRWPGGSWGDKLDWSDTKCEFGKATTDEANAFVAAVGAHLQPIVNFSGYWCGAQHTHAEAVQKAADWVKYQNVTHNFGTKIWEVGNEDYGSWEQGYTDGATYGSEFADYYKAMKAVDPTIRVGAVTVPSLTDYNGWSIKMLNAAKAKGVIPDYLVIHHYSAGGVGTGTSALDATFLGTVNDVSTMTTALNQIVSQTLGASYVGKIGYRMTEYNRRDNLPATALYVNAMFVAQNQMEIALHGWAGANMWVARNGGGADGTPGFLDPVTNAPRPDYYVFPFFAAKFAGSSMVKATSANSSVRTYAAKDASGHLTLFLVNNNPTTTVSASVNVAGFKAAPSAAKWVMRPGGTAPAGAPQEATGLMLNGVLNPAPANIATIPGLPQAGTNAFTVSLPPSAMVYVLLSAG